MTRRTPLGPEDSLLQVEHQAVPRVHVLQPARDRVAVVHVDPMDLQSFCQTKCVEAIDSRQPMNDIEAMLLQHAAGVDEERFVLGPRVQLEHRDRHEIDFVFQFVVDRLADDGYLMAQLLQSAEQVYAVSLGPALFQRTIASDDGDMHGVIGSRDE
jgi:hypothetical protein